MKYHFFVERKPLKNFFLNFRTCKSDKRRPLSSDYPSLCPTLEMVPNAADYCNKNNRWRTEKLNNKTLAKEIEWEIHNYARENLAIINIFIKEPSLKRQFYFLFVLFGSGISNFL